MSRLAIAALILGGGVAVLHAPCLIAPSRARVWLAGFPRNPWAGWLLTAVALAWSAWLIMHIPLGGFDKWKPALYVAAPLLFVLVVLLMDELLAARALGGLLMLVPSPLLDAARPHESELRLVVTVLAYGLVMAGMALILCPYLFRQAAAWGTRTDTRCRLWGSAGLAAGLFVIVLALTIY